MGKIVQMPGILEKEQKAFYNIEQLKVLTNKYITKNKKFVLNKLKAEQNGK